MFLAIFLKSQQSEYTSIADRLSEYTYKLLNEVHDNEELMILLSRDGQKFDRVGLPRLYLADICQQKQVGATVGTYMEWTYWLDGYILFFASDRNIHSSSHTHPVNKLFANDG